MSEIKNLQFKNTDIEFLEIEIRRLKSLMSSRIFNRNEVLKKSITTYLRFLECLKDFQNECEDIFGRWILIHEGDIFPKYFMTPQDTFDEDLKYLLFQIPSKSNKM
jgi:hypothetical protein